VTYTTRYGEAGWALIDGLDRHYDKAVFDGTWSKNDLTIKTENIRRVRLFRVDHPFPKAIVIDGRTVATPQQHVTGRERVLGLMKSEGMWAVAEPDRRQKPEKVNGIQGPIDDAFMRPFLVVPPSATMGISAYPIVAFSEFGHIWQKYFRGTLPWKAKDDVTDDDIGRDNLVLFGDPHSNPLIARVLPKLPIQWTKDELVVNGVKYDPRTHVPVLIYPNPLNPGRYVVLNSGHTFREADLKGTNANLYPRLGDWAVLKPTPTKDDPAAAEVVAAGLFDEFWQFAKK
jgi:hypothetical protein